MSDQPKPTGEWTVFGTSVKRLGDDDSLFHCSTRTDADVAIRTHNAALATEREQSVDVEGLKNAARTIKQLREQLERERMCHAACGVIAMSNTAESLAKNRDMKPEYLSASVQDCIRAIERELQLREQLADSEKSRTRMQQAVMNGQRLNDALDLNDKLQAQLAAAQAAIKEHNNSLSHANKKAYEIKIGDTTALGAAIAAALKALEPLARIANVKEGK